MVSVTIAVLILFFFCRYKCFDYLIVSRAFASECRGYLVHSSICICLSGPWLPGLRLHKIFCPSIHPYLFILALAFWACLPGHAPWPWSSGPFRLAWHPRPDFLGLSSTPSLQEMIS